MERKKQEVLALCTCRACPSFSECGEDIGYCFPNVGKSKCIADEQGYICGGCPVFSKLSLKNVFYCTRGSEKDQSA